jgi:hypothetical protein
MQTVFFRILKDYKNDFKYHLQTFWASQSFLISLAHNGKAQRQGRTARPLLLLRA